MSPAISSCRSLRAAWPTSLKPFPSGTIPSGNNTRHRHPRWRVLFCFARIGEGHHGKPQAVSRHPARTHPGLSRLLRALGIGLSLYQDRLRPLWYSRARQRLAAALRGPALHPCRHAGHCWHERGPAPTARSASARYQAHLHLVALPDYRAVLLFLPGPLARQRHVELHHRGQRQLPRNLLCRPGISHREAQCGQSARLRTGLCRRRARQPFGRGRHLWLYARRRGFYPSLHRRGCPFDLPDRYLLA